jgi:CRISPR-associated protein Csm2
MNTHPKPKVDIASKIVHKVDQFEGLQEYTIRELVEDTDKLGSYLAKKGLKTTQIRKFLDAVNQVKVKLDTSKSATQEASDEVQLLRPKLAYAAARQSKKNDPGPVEPFKVVLEAAIKKVRQEPVYFQEDFKRLTQLIESIIAYHKAAGGKDQ